ncbi:unnamed protein product [Rhodiola kirilowii]
MRIFSWNCWGLGRPRTVRALREAIKSQSPQIVCLMETKKRAAEVEGMKFRFDFSNCFDVNSCGHLGGLAILWAESVRLEIKSYSFWHINAVVRDHSEFRLSLFYGEPLVSKRVESWNLLRRLRNLLSILWMVLGDFNEVLCVNEARGVRQRQSWQVDNFRDAVEDCGLSDVGFTGFPFTFSNRRQEEAEYQARLDRVLADDIGGGRIREL